MKFAFVAKHRGIWTVAWACKALDVSSSGFHDWLNRRPAKRALENESLISLIRRSFHDSDRTYGTCAALLADKGYDAASFIQILRVRSIILKRVTL